MALLISKAEMYFNLNFELKEKVFQIFFVRIQVSYNSISEKRKIM